MFRSIIVAAVASTWAMSAAAATFTVIDDNSATVVGTFDAPNAGGAVTAGSFSLEGGVFDDLGIGAQAPLYDAANNWVTGTPGGFGTFSNSVAFNTMDFLNNAITCGVGECIFSLTSSGGAPVPAEWYLDYVPVVGASSPIALGFYKVQTAAVPLPAPFILLLSSLAALGLRRTRIKT